jgi:hypothetical protein
MDSNTISAAKAVSKILIQLDDFPYTTKRAILKFVEHLIDRSAGSEFDNRDFGDEMELKDL